MQLDGTCNGPRLEIQNVRGAIKNDLGQMNMQW